MSVVTDSLSRLENEHQETLDHLHELREQDTLTNNNLGILDNLEEVVKDWDQIFGGSVASDTIGEKVEEVRYSPDKAMKIKELDIFVDPLRHYVIGLEKYQREEYRETVTRCGMVIERIIQEISLELGVEVEEDKTEDAFGKIQSTLEASGIPRAREFVSHLKGIYSIRNDRGPHDVPAAELIQAKRAISGLMWGYYRYLRIISEVGSWSLSEEDIDDFTELLDIIVEFRPNLVIGEKGEEPSLRELLIRDLFRNGFFKEPQSFSDVKEELQSKRYNPPDSTLADNLKKLTGEMLKRQGSRGSYEYVEKVPPGDYFE